MADVQDAGQVWIALKRHLFRQIAQGRRGNAEDEYEEEHELWVGLQSTAGVLQRNRALLPGHCCL